MSYYSLFLNEESKINLGLSSKSMYHGSEYSSSYLEDGIASTVNGDYRFSGIGFTSTYCNH